MTWSTRVLAAPTAGAFLAKPITDGKGIECHLLAWNAVACKKVAWNAFAILDGFGQKESPVHAAKTLVNHVKASTTKAGNDSATGAFTKEVCRA